LYCCNTEVEVGSLRRGDRFSDLWSGPAWDALRGRLRAGEYFPGCQQCGKLNQNVKLAERFRRRYGDARWREITGQVGDDAELARAPSEADVARAVSQLRLRVLP
jgi:hypothetical protein